jgi:hypothetical protein
VTIGGFQHVVVGSGLSGAVAREEVPLLVRLEAAKRPRVRDMAVTAVRHGGRVPFEVFAMAHLVRVGRDHRFVIVPEGGNRKRRISEQNRFKAKAPTFGSGSLRETRMGAPRRSDAQFPNFWIMLREAGSHHE